GRGADRRGRVGRGDDRAAGTVEVPERLERVVVGDDLSGLDRDLHGRDVGVRIRQGHVRVGRAAVEDAQVAVEVRRAVVQLRDAGDDDARGGGLRRIDGEDEQRIAGEVVED